MSDSQILITPEFRMSFPNFVEAKAFQNKGDKFYGAECLLEADSLTEFKMWDETANQGSGDFIDADIRKVCARVAKSKWPDIDLKSAFSPGKGWPIHDGDVQAAKREAANKSGDVYKGMKVIRVKANEEYPPQLYYVEGTEKKQIARGLASDEARAKQLFVGGNYAYAEITVKAVETPQGKFVTLYVNSVRFTRTGERLGGPRLMERFDGVQGGEADHDPTEGMDDDIPF